MSFVNWNLQVQSLEYNFIYIEKAVDGLLVYVCLCLTVCVVYFSVLFHSFWR